MRVVLALSPVTSCICNNLHLAHDVPETRKGSEKRQLDVNILTSQDLRKAETQAKQAAPGGSSKFTPLKLAR